MTDELNISLDAIEPLVREALTAAVARDPGRSAQALEAMGDQTSHAILLATLINIYALDATRTQASTPTSQTLQVVADRFQTLEAWAGFDSDEVLNYVHSIANIQNDRQPVSADAASRMAFVMGAHLLSAYSNEPWYERLDTILNRIEAARA